MVSGTKALLILHKRATIIGTKTQNTEWLATDYIPNVIGNITEDLICQFSLSVIAIIEVTFDSGTNWTALNSGVALPADQLFQFEIFVTDTDKINFRTPTVGGTTVDIGYIVADLGA